MPKQSRINAFPEGNSLVARNRELNKLLVANPIGVLKIFDPDLEFEPSSIDILSNPTSIHTFDKKLVVTNTEGHLELVDLNTNESQGVIYRAELPLRDAVLINEGKRVICGGDDDKLVVVNLDESKKASTLKLPQQVVNLGYDPQTELLVVSLSNGDLQIYSVSKEEISILDTKPAHVLPKVHVSTDEIDYLGEHKDELVASRCQFAGQTLFYPSSESLKSLDLRTGASGSDYVSGTPDTIVDFQVDPSHSYVAVLYKNKKVAVYLTKQDLQTEIPLDSESDEVFTSLVWIGQRLYVGSSSGSVIFITELGLEVQNSNSAVLDEAEEADESESEALNGHARTNGVSRYTSGIDDSIIDEEDSDNELPYPDDRRSYKRQKTSNGVAGPVIVNDDIVPYSPGITPFIKTATAERRYLTMSLIGYVWVVKSSDENTQTITVSFYDHSVNKDYHFSDFNNFDLCSLSHQGLLLCHSSYKSSKPFGLVYFRNHEREEDSWSKKIPLNPDEYITSVSMSNNEESIIVVGTNFGYLRFYNRYGVCLHIVKVNPVAAVISSDTNGVFVVSKLSVNLYSYSLVNTNEEFRFIQQDSVLPLKAASRSPLIKGLFFNDLNDPCLVAGNDDTLMVLSSWRESANAKWIPVLNCQQQVTENGADGKKNWKCWPLGMYADYLGCLVLKGNDQYPGFPLPMPVELEFKLPIHYIDPQEPESENYEEKYLQSKTLGEIVNASLTDQELQQQTEEISERLTEYTRAYDRSLLGMFAEACREGDMSKSLSIAKMMRSDTALVSASKISQRFEFNNLATKIGKLRDVLMAMEAD